MEKLTFGLKTPDPRPAEDLFRLTLEMRVKAFNEAEEKDDGTGINCPLCRNKGFTAFISEETGSLTTRPCRCAPSRRTIRGLKQIGVWERAKRCTFQGFRTDTPTQKTMRDTAWAFVNAPQGRWLALMGQSGCGKTHLTTAAFVAVTRRCGLEGEYMQWNADGRKLKSSVMEDTAGDWERFKECQILLIDDLFKVRSDLTPSDADVRLAFELLDYRYNNHLITILSSEMTLEQILELDQAIAGRIKERCGPYLVNIAPDVSKNFRLQDHSA